MFNALRVSIGWTNGLSTISVAENSPTKSISLKMAATYRIVNVNVKNVKRIESSI